ncbi:hypothetical protein HG531_005882 [Fusarium graminearum]|nr:hypothetical protein HG531_005882 [Fusarium graminearum]
MAGASKTKRSIPNLDLGISVRRLDCLFERRRVTTEFELHIGRYNERGRLVKVKSARRKLHVVTSVELGIGEQLAMQPGSVNDASEWLTLAEALHHHPDALALADVEEENVSVELD